MNCSLGVQPVAKAVLVAVLLAAEAFAAPNPTAKKDEFQLTAPHAILIEAESGSVLYEKNADHLVAPASLAKLMTVEVVFDQIKLGNITLEQEFTISERAWRKGGAPSGGSAMYAPVHSRVQVRDLLQGAIIQSGNDASIALAEGVAGNEEEFVRLMNERARELGLVKSRFTNPTGLSDPNMRVTVREIAKLAAHIIRTYPEYYRWYGEREFTWNKIRQFNRNPLLAMGIGADGMKTGYTREAGYNLVGSAVQNGLRLIAVIAGARSEKDRAEEGKRLLEWGFKGFEARQLFAAHQIVAEARLFGGAKGSVPLLTQSAIRIMLPRGGNERITAKVVYRGPVRAPVTQGQPIGTLKVWRGDLLTIEAPLEAAESVTAGSATQRALDAASELMINLFRVGAQQL